MNKTATAVWRRCRCVLPVVLPALPALPALALLRLIRTHAINIPFLDDWMFVDMDQKARDGILSLHDFFVVQMEHRMAFVRAVIMLFHQLWPADYIRLLMLNWTLLVLTFVNVGILLRRTSPAPLRGCWWVLLLMSAAIFSPVQFQLVLWPMMFQVACPAFFLSTAMVALLGRMPLWVRFFIGIVCAICATLSFATGILVWVLLVPLIWFSDAIPQTRRRIVYLTAWTVAFAVTMALYFHNLHNEVDSSFAYKQGEDETLHRDLGAFFSHPGVALHFVLLVLGGNLGRGTSLGLVDACTVVGAVSLALYLSASAWFCLNFRNRELRLKLLPWLVFGAYSVGAGVLIAMGRVWASRNGENALLPRYVIHAIPLTVSLVALAWIVVADLRSRRPEWNTRVSSALSGAVLALAILLVISWGHGIRMMEWWESSRLRVATNTLFYKLLPDFEGDIGTKREYARRADTLKLLNPPMLRDLKLDNFSRSTALLSENSAMWNELSVERTGGNVVGLAHGYACLPQRTRVADGVFLTYRDPADGHWQIFHVTQVSAMPLSMLQTGSRDLQFIHVGGDLHKEAVAEFHARFRFSDLPAGTFKVAAWAFDYKLRRVYPMAGFYEINTTAQTVRALSDFPRQEAKLGRQLDRTLREKDDKKNATAP